MRADFYLITAERFREQPLLLVCELVKKAFNAGQPTLVLARDFAQAEALDALLWEFNPDLFLPHQIAGDEDDAETPILIVPPGVEIPDRPLVVNLRETVPDGHFERVLEVVAADEGERAGSRERWKHYREHGFAVRKFDL